MKGKASGRRGSDNAAAANPTTCLADAAAGSPTSATCHSGDSVSGFQWFSGRWRKKRGEDELISYLFAVGRTLKTAAFVYGDPDAAGVWHGGTPQSMSKPHGSVARKASPETFSATVAEAVAAAATAAAIPSA